MAVAERAAMALHKSAVRILRGATMIEYALVIIAIMFFAAVAFRQLGKTVRMNADRASGELIKNGQGE